MIYKKESTGEFERLFTYEEFIALAKKRGDIGSGGGSATGLTTLADTSEWATFDASSVDAGTAVDTLGYAAAGDNGADRYEIRATSVTADNFLVFDTATAGKQAHLLQKEPRVFHALKAGADRTGVADTGVIFDRMFAAAPDDGEYTTLFFPAGTYKFTDIDYNKLLNKKIRLRGRRGKTVFLGDDTQSDTDKGQKTLLKLHSDFDCQGITFRHFGSPINGGSLSVVGSSQDDVEIKIHKCRFEDCNFMYDALGGGTGDADANNFNTIEKFEIQDVHCERVIKPIQSRIKKYGDIYWRNVTLVDCNDDSDFNGSANHAAIRFGQDHGGTSEDDRTFKTVKSFVIDNLKIDGVSVTGDMQAYAANFYVHDVQIINSSIRNVQQDFGGTKFTRPVSGTYFRGRMGLVRGCRYRDCSHGSDNGMLHVKSAGSPNLATNNHFEITEDYINIDTSMTPIGISAEKQGTYNNNTFRNVHEPIRAQDDTGSTRDYDVSHNLCTVDSSLVTDCKITIGGKASTNCTFNRFPNGGRITQGLFVSDEAIQFRINDNYMRSPSGSPRSVGITVLQLAKELTEVSRNTIIAEEEQAGNFISLTNGLAGGTFRANDNYIKTPNDANTWSGNRSGIIISFGEVGRLCELKRNTVINLKGPGIRYRAAFDNLDIEDFHMEGYVGTIGAEVWFDGATLNNTRVVSRSGDFKTMVESISEISSATGNTVAHGVDAVEGEGRNAIIPGEVELRVLGDMSPATKIWTENYTATQFDIVLDDTPTNPVDIKWIAKRTDQFA